MGKQLLAVDKDLVRQEKMFFSRDPIELINRFNKSDKTFPDLNKAKEVKAEVIKKTIEFLRKHS